MATGPKTMNIGGQEFPVREDENDSRRRPDGSDPNDVSVGSAEQRAAAGKKLAEGEKPGEGGMKASNDASNQKVAPAPLEKVGGVEQFDKASEGGPKEVMQSGGHGALPAATVEPENTVDDLRTAFKREKERSGQLEKAWKETDAKIAQMKRDNEQLTKRNEALQVEVRNLNRELTITKAENAKPTTDEKDSMGMPKVKGL